MDRNVRGGTLLIRTAGDQSEVEISGASADIIFNWTALTHQVSKALNVPLVALAGPGMLEGGVRTVRAASPCPSCSGEFSPLISL